MGTEVCEARNLAEVEAMARARMGEGALDYLAGGADDSRTVRANRSAFAEISIRARRLIDVSSIDTTVSIFGRTLETPIALAPVGFQQLFHSDGELATARAAAARGHLTILSSVSSFAVAEIAAVSGAPPWFQLYPTPDRKVTRGLLARAEDAGCPVVVLTADVPVLGNRESHEVDLLEMLHSGAMRLGNYEGLVDSPQINDPSMTWEMIEWLRSSCSMKVVVKGLVTEEDAALAVDYGADALIVSNHGGRQEESDRSSIECLPEVARAVGARVPILIDGGFRRGSDIFKALALGADAVCVGRPYCYGLAAAGREGVERVLEILQDELVRIMQLAGTPSLADVGPEFVRAPPDWLRGEVDRG